MDIERIGQAKRTDRLISNDEVTLRLTVQRVLSPEQQGLLPKDRQCEWNPVTCRRMRVAGGSVMLRRFRGQMR
jgi:hypothetical protein